MEWVERDGRVVSRDCATSAEIAKMWVSNKLPSDGRLAPLALKMINRIVEWIHTVNKHLDLEYTKLTQQHILEDDALILLSKELIIMFPRIQAVRMQRMEFCVSHTNKVDCMTGCIWITYQVHWVMQEFMQGGLHHNVAIVIAFLHFLMKTTAGSLAVGGGGQLKTLIDKVEKLQTAVATAMATSKDALKGSMEAITRASTANINADAAKNAVNAFYSKNPSLKC